MILRIISFALVVWILALAPVLITLTQHHLHLEGLLYLSCIQGVQTVIVVGLLLLFGFIRRRFHTFPSSGMLLGLIYVFLMLPLIISFAILSEGGMYLFAMVSPTAWLLGFLPLSRGFPGLSEKLQMFLLLFFALLIVFFGWAYYFYLGKLSDRVIFKQR